MSAEEVEVDGIAYTLNSDGTAEVISKSPQYSGDIIIPSGIEYSGKHYSVTSIGNGAFSGCRLSSVDIPNSVTTIGSDAFLECNYLQTVIIPESVTSIGDRAFYYHNTLGLFIIKGTNVNFGEEVLYYPRNNDPTWSRIYVPEGVNYNGSEDFPWPVTRFDSETSKVMKDGTILSDNGKTLLCAPIHRNTSYTIPEGVKKIAAWSICYMDQNDVWLSPNRFKTLTIPSTIEEIEADVFLHYKIEKVYFSDWNKWYANVKLGNLYSNPYWNSTPYIGDDKVETPELPEGITEIPDYKNYGLWFKGEVEIPRSVRKIGAYAFYNNEDLTSVILPDGLEEIGQSAFEGCTSLKSVNIPNSVTTIGSDAFLECKGLQTVIIPESVTSIGDRAFYCGFYGLFIIKGTNVNFGQEVLYQQYRGPGGFTIIYVPEGLNYNNSESGEFPWNVRRFDAESSTVMKDGTIISDNGKTLLFAPVHWNTSYTIPEGVTKIPAWSFSFRDYTESFDEIPYSFKTLTIPSTIEEIEADVFRRYKIGKVNITDWDKWYANVKLGNIYSNPYWNSTPYIGDDKVETPELPEGITEISDYINYGLQFKGDIEIPKSVKRIGAYAFYDNRGLNSVILPDGLEEIGQSAFEGCSSLRSVNIPKSVTSVGERAYYGCYNLDIWIIQGTNVNFGNDIFSRSPGYIFAPEGLDCSALRYKVSTFEPGSTVFMKDGTILADNGKTLFFVPVYEGIYGGMSYAIPEGVTKIPAGAFTKMYNGEKIVFDTLTIPSTIEEIEADVFNSSVEIKKVNFTDWTKWYANAKLGNFYSNPYWNSTPYAAGVKVVTPELPEGITEIPDYKNYGLQFKGEVEIPSSVKRIGAYAFYNNKELNSVILPDGLEEIGQSAFEGCASLKSVNIPKSVTSVGEKAYSRCYNLEIWVIQGTNVNFGNNIFSSSPRYVFTPEGLDCSALKCNVRTFKSGSTVFREDGTILADNGKTLFFVPVYEGIYGGMSYAIPEGVTKIPAGAFTKMYNGEKIVFDTLTIPSTIEEIEADVFNSSVEIKKVNFTDWIKWFANAKLGNFYSNPYWNSTPYVGGVQMVTPALPDGITEIADYINYGLQFRDEIEIPQTVKRIGAYAFYNNKELYSVVLPECLEEIGESAFEGCELLENPSFPSGLKKIEKSAYLNCKSITEILLPAGLSELGEKETQKQIEKKNAGGVFEGCSALEKAVLAVDIDYIEDNLLKDCGQLQKVYLPLQLKSIGESAFENCKSLDEITLPSTLESIGNSAFRNGSLTKLVIPDRVKHIGESAFANQTIASLKIGKSLDVIPAYAFDGNPLNVLELSEGLTKIGVDAFAGSGNIGSVDIPSTVTEIANGAFKDKSIRSLVIPDKVISLGAESCGKPSVLTLGSGIKDIAADAFSFDNLYTMRLRAHMPPALSAAFPLTEAQNDQLTLIVNKGRHDTYNTNARWKQINRIIEEGESEVTVYLDGTYSLAEEIRIQSGYMPSVITKMKVDGPLSAADLRVIKENMISLTSLDLSAVTNVTEIPENQFAGSLITGIELPSNIETIGDGAFSSCSLLQLTGLPASLKRIGNNAFNNCPGVNIAELPQRLEYIGSAAFSRSGMTQLVGVESLSEIGSDAFSNCTLLERADLSMTSINRISDNVFSGCSELDEVILPGSVESIGDSAFSGTALRNIDFASEVSSIGDDAFSSNRRLVSATLPESLTTVGSNLFASCPRLISVSMPQSTIAVKSKILSGDRKLANLSCSAIEAPEAETGAFDDVRYRYVTLTIPTLSFRNYLIAPQWGKFENMKNTLKVEIDNGVTVTNATEKEYQDMLMEDDLEAKQEAASEQSGDIASSRVKRRAASRAATVQKFASLFDGAQLMSGADGSVNRIFITPEPGVNVLSILLNGEELLPKYDGYSILLPEGCNGSLKIITDASEDLKVESITLPGSFCEDSVVDVYDMQGTVVRYSCDREELQQLTPGMYIIRSSNGATRKVVIR